MTDKLNQEWKETGAQLMAALVCTGLSVGHLINDGSLWNYKYSYCQFARSECDKCLWWLILQKKGKDMEAASGGKKDDYDIAVRELMFEMRAKVGSILSFMHTSEFAA